MKNKKGFTLIEILAVIAILALVALLIVALVIPAINKKNKKDFITNANYYIQTATKVYSDKKREDNNITELCLSIKDLNKEIKLKNKKSYKGYVKVNLNSKTNEVSYVISLANNKLYTILNDQYELKKDEINIKNLKSDELPKSFSDKCN